MSELHPTHPPHPTRPAHHTPSESDSASTEASRSHGHDSAADLDRPRLESSHPTHESTTEATLDAEFTFDPEHPVLVSIRWKDAESQGGPTWEDTDDMLEFARRPLTTVLTVGVLLHMDPEQIAVTDTVAFDQMGGVTKIPRGWIERIDELGPVPSDLVERAEQPDQADRPGRSPDRLDHHPRRVG